MITRILNDYFLDRLHAVLNEQIKSNPSLKAGKKISPVKISNDIEAARLIQKLWRLSKLKKNINKFGYKFYVEMLSINNEINMLAQLMFGRTIASIQSDSDFPIANPFTHKNAFYHRSDNLSGKLLSIIINKYDSTPDSKIYQYIPVISTNSLSIAVFLDVYCKDEKQCIEIISCGNNSLFLLKIKSNIIQYDRFHEKLKSAGMIASPWDMSVCVAKFHHQPVPEKSNHFMCVIANMPSNSAELKESNIMIDLAKIAINKKTNISLLAACLFRMLFSLPETNDPYIINRISLFAELAIHFYKHDYQKFSFMVYAITHEISLILYENLANNVNTIDYMQFKNKTVEHALSAFGLNVEKLNNSCDFISIPTVSGTNSFVVAMSLAQHMIPASRKQPTIQIVSPYYYEFESIYAINKGSDLADIYVLTTGPVMSAQGIYPGIDMNNFVRNYIIKNQPTIKSVTLVIDTTTTLYSNLRLDEDIKKLVEDGVISIIVNESHQKFGLVHTDQAQYGRVLGICSKVSFTRNIIDQFEDNAKQDLSTHLDMIIGSYIYLNCQEYLERIKINHFKNGALSRNMLSQLNMLSADIVSYNRMIDDINQVYFLSTIKFIQGNNRLIISRISKVLCDVYTSRDSFGHFSATLSQVGKLCRISPDASDQIDNVLKMTELYLVYTYDVNRLSNILNTWMEALIFNQKHKNLNLAEEVLLLSILKTLISLKYNPSSSIHIYLWLYSYRYVEFNFNYILMDNNYCHKLNDHYFRIKSEYKMKDNYGKYIVDFISRPDATIYIDRFLINLNKLSKLEANTLAYREEYIVCLANLALFSKGLWNLVAQHSQNSIMNQVDFCYMINNLNQRGFLNKSTLYQLLDKTGWIEKRIAVINLLANGSLLERDVMNIILANNEHAFFFMHAIESIYSIDTSINITKDDVDVLLGDVDTCLILSTTIPDICLLCLKSETELDPILEKLTKKDKLILYDRIKNNIKINNSIVTPDKIRILQEKFSKSLANDCIQVCREERRFSFFSGFFSNNIDDLVKLNPQTYEDVEGFFKSSDEQNGFSRIMQKFH